MYYKSIITKNIHPTLATAIVLYLVKINIRYITIMQHENEESA